MPEHLMTAAAVPSLERQQVLAGLGSSGRGLSADEAAARRAEIGANQLPAPRRRPVLAEFGAQFANMFAVVLMVAAGITFVAYALTTPRSSANLVLAIGILGVVLLNAVIGFAQEHAAERTAEALQALVPATARVIRDGELTEIPAVDLVPGDLVMLDAGDAISADCRLLGLVAMSDPPRPEVTDAVAACRRAGIRIYMITGDYGLTAEAIARRVGIVGDGAVRIVNGADLDAMSDEQLADAALESEQLLFARARPEHKMRVVAALQDRGEVVAVTGDGVNDAPALKRASIGVSMGEGGTDVARAASVMILLDDSFASIVAAVELGRTVYQNIRKFLIYLFSHNLAELAPILVAVFVGFPLVPLSALQVLAIDLGSDVLPALALGTERTEPGTMSRPPRPPGEHLFNWAVVRRFCFLGSIQAAGVVAAFFWKIDSAHLPFSAFTADNPIYREALTMTQAGIVVSQFFNSFAVRTEEQSILRVGVFSNKPLVFAGLFGVFFVACISYVPALQSVFNTAPLSAIDWGVLVAFGALLLIAEETRKALLRHRHRDRRSPQARLDLPANLPLPAKEEACTS